MVWSAIMAGVAGWLWCRRPGELARRLAPPPNPRGPIPHRHVVSARQVAELAEQMATALDAGLSMPEAWAYASRTDSPVEATDRAGRDALLALRAALRLTDALGVPAAGLLRAVATSIRDRIDGEAVRRAAASGPVAAAWIVAGLPVAGPVLGAALGIDPIGILVGTAWGRATGLIGLVLLAVGALWSRRLVLRARAAASQ